MKTISAENERRVLTAVEHATRAIDEYGLSPSQAVVKAARANNLQPTMLPLVVHALNTGRQTHQRRSETGILDKLASFPLADLDEVQRELYPETIETPDEALHKTAVSVEYAAPPQPLAGGLTKVASAWPEELVPKLVPYPRDPAIVMGHAYNQARGVKQATERARAACNAASDAMLEAFGKLAHYFWQAPLDRLPLAEVDHNAQLLFGKLGESIMDYVCEHNAQSGRREKRASQVPYEHRPVDRQAEPYSLITTVIQRAEAYTEAQAEWRTKSAMAIRQIDDLVGSYEPVRMGPVSILTGRATPMEKPAGTFSQMLAAGLGGGLGAGFQHTGRGLSGSSTDELVSAAENSLLDSSHENELRAIQAKSQLADFMANDEVIKHYDPQQVLRAYNEISQLSPHASTQPAIMRPLLRRQLSQGSTEPHEAHQLTEIEGNLRDNAGPRPQASKPKPQAQPQGGSRVGQSLMA